MPDCIQKTNLFCNHCNSVVCKYCLSKLNNNRADCLRESISNRSCVVLGCYKLTEIYCAHCRLVLCYKHFKLHKIRSNCILTNLTENEGK